MPIRLRQKLQPSSGSSMYPSVSEDNGIAALVNSDQRVYSVGVSTGAIAEMRMATASSTRRIIATTIDGEGAKFCQKQIEEAGFLNQIEIKLEDVSSPLPYPNAYFDFIYARLVLHYLPKNNLIQALTELHRALKTGSKLFVVVRSTDCFEAKDNHSIFDLDTGMTAYTSNDNSYSRYFHTKESIQNFLVSAGFHIEYVKTYEEQLCVDFYRTQLSEQMDVLIEVLASKIN